MSILDEKWVNEKSTGFAGLRGWPSAGYGLREDEGDDLLEPLSKTRDASPGTAGTDDLGSR